MSYVPNPEKAKKWGEAISTGTGVFNKIEEETKAGFTRPILKKIMKPVWPFFNKLDNDEVEQVYLDMEEFFKDFWDEYKLRVAESKHNGLTEDEIEPVSTMFFSYLSMSLTDCHLYDQIKLSAAAV